MVQVAIFTEELRDGLDTNTRRSHHLPPGDIDDKLGWHLPPLGIVRRRENGLRPRLSPHEVFDGFARCRCRRACIEQRGSVDTSIGRTASGALVIVQVIYSEPDIDEDALFGNLDDAIFIDPAEAVEISFGSADLVMFDTADPGDDIESGMKSFRLDPGSYKVSAKMFSPDLTFGSVLYKFERVVEPKEG